MYQLNQEQLASVEGWIKSLPDSMVKSNYEKWLSELKPKERVTSEQLEKFLSYANSLPKEFQNYPQEFAISIKNKLTPTSNVGNGESVKNVSNKDAVNPDTDKVREGAKLHPDKEVETKIVKPVVIVKGGKK